METDLATLNRTHATREVLLPSGLPETARQPRGTCLGKSNTQNTRHSCGGTALLQVLSTFQYPASESTLLLTSCAPFVINLSRGALAPQPVSSRYHPLYRGNHERHPRHHTPSGSTRLLETGQFRAQSFRKSFAVLPSTKARSLSD